jgi:hypothetical protein
MTPKIVSTHLFLDITRLIETTKQQVSQAFNANYSLLAWNIGTRIVQEILFNKRATYNQRIVQDLSEQLKLKYGRGFDKTSLLCADEEKLRDAIKIAQNKYDIPPLLSDENDNSEI